MSDQPQERATSEQVPAPARPQLSLPLSIGGIALAFALGLGAGHFTRLTAPPIGSFTEQGLALLRVRQPLVIVRARKLSCGRGKTA